MTAIEKLIAIERAEVGYVEKSLSAYRANPDVLDNKTAGAGSDNYTKYARDVAKTAIFNGNKQGFAYCTTGQIWSFLQAFGEANVMKMFYLPSRSMAAGVNYMRDYFQAAGALYDYPEVGDIVHFGTAHVGLVVKVVGNQFWTIEFNTSGGNTVVANGGGVFEKGAYTINSTHKFGRPNWSVVDSNYIPPKATITTVILKKGSSGEAVKSLQTDLNILGYNCGTVDGGFGDKTYAAVVSFQQAFFPNQPKEWDGEAGTKTLEAIKDSMALKEQQVKSVHPYGIDISVYQGNFDFNKAVAEGVKFVIIKGGGGDSGYYVDKNFITNYTKAKTAKLNVGVYWFSKALSVADAKKEAEYFYENVLKGRQFELPVYIDVENKTQLALGKRMVTDIIKTWCEYLKALNYCVGVYMSKSAFDGYTYDTELKDYEHWIAQWSKLCTYNGDYGMWQFGGETNPLRYNTVAGVVCDQDYMLKDYPTIIKSSGKNGFGTNIPQKVNTYNVQLKEVKKGDKGVLVAMIQTALAYHGYKNYLGTSGIDGDFGSGTESALRKFQVDNSLTSNGIVDENTFNKLIK